MDADVEAAVVFEPVNAVCLHSGSLCVERGVLREVSLEERRGGDETNVRHGGEDHR